MKISLTDAGKRFNRDWIFRHFNYNFESGNAYAITGANGSGKSTLLQVIGSSMMISEGKIEYQNGKLLSSDKIYTQVSICAPYLDLVEEMTLKEFLEFHSSFKPFLKTITSAQIINLIGLDNAADKQIRNFSSGMKQRVKLAQCIFSNTMIVLLDEPCTNLDMAGIELYKQLINDYCKDRLVIVSSNDTAEYDFCKIILRMIDLK